MNQWFWLVPTLFYKEKTFFAVLLSSIVHPCKNCDQMQLKQKDRPTKGYAQLQRKKKSMTFIFPQRTFCFCFLGCDRVGEVPGPRLKRHAVYRVSDVVLVPLVPPHLVPGDAPLSHQLGLKPCPKHHGGKLIYHLYSCIYILTICKYTQTVVGLQAKRKSFHRL